MTRLWSYISDVEGNLDYWNRYLSISKIVHRNENNGKLELKENCGFIFGGDSVDKGSGDIRIVHDLLQLKEDYPDRVYLLIGNRDANKLRFASELAGDDTLGVAYWVDKEKRVSLESFLEKNNLEDNKVSRIKWMLAETMGSATTFQLRREELETLGKETNDEAVLNSFIEGISVGGEDPYMLKYLRAGCLMAKVGKNLIVHGGLSDNNIGTVPGDDKIRESVDDWMKDLNQFVQNELDDYESQPTWKELPDSETGRGKRGGDGLMDYGVPGGNNDKTVVYCTFLSNGNAKPLSNPVVEYCEKNNIHRVLAGHTPHGDCPTVIAEKVQVILVDTSYSDMSKPDNRGDAVSELILNEEDETVLVHGQLKDGRKIEYELAPPGSVKGDHLVGKQLADDYWVKSELKETPEDGKKYMICKGEGYKLSVDWKTTEEIASTLLHF